MTIISPPKYVKDILKTLELYDHSAFLVGGCVRDMMRGKRPHDWDICTSATPDEVINIFPKTIPTGIKHGTVTVISGKRQVEVTTLRSDGGYINHRRPENVVFISDMTQDLQRRDFTINAVALTLAGLVIDPLGGSADMDAKLIRCVGNPDDRFEEDALRMFRAVRFSAQLGYDIEQATDEAIYRKAHLASALSAERVRSELEKILLSPSPAMLGRIFSYGLMDSYTSNRRPFADFGKLRRLRKNKPQLWAGACAILENMRVIHSTADFLSSLRLPNTTIRLCGTGVSIARENPPSDRLDWKYLLAEHGVDVAWCVAAALEVLRPERSMHTLRSVLKSQECFSLRRLAISGDDLLEMGYVGEELGQTLKYLLHYVIEFPDDNDKEFLLDMAMLLRRHSVAGSRSASTFD